MSGLNFNITANNSDFKRKLQEVDAGVSRTTKAIEASGQSVESYFRKMTAGAAALAAGFSARELVSNIVQTRGEMQQYCMEEISVNPDRFFKSEDLNRIKKYAFEHGRPVELYIRMIGILIRNAYLESKGIDLSEIDK